jgi:ligand-binding sensor domain-containing protein
MKNLIAFLIIIQTAFIANGQWVKTDFPDSLEYRSVLLIDSVIYAKASDEKIYQSTDLGQTWSIIMNGLNVNKIYTLYKYNTNNQYFIYAGTDKGVYEYDESGNIWNELNIGIENKKCYSIVRSGQIMLAGGEQPNLYRSTNAGNNWIEIPVGSAGQSASSLLIDSNLVIVSFNNIGNYIYKSDDFGQTWIASNTGIIGGALRSLTKWDNKYVVSDYASIFESTDQGATWMLNNNNLPGSLLPIPALKEISGYLFIVSFSGIYILQAADTVVTDVSSNLSSIIVNNFSFYSNDSDPDFTVLGGDGIFIRPTQEMINIKVGINENTNFQSAISIFPNPTTGKLNIDLGRNYPEVSIAVRNIIGQVLFIENFKNRNTVNFEISGSAGIYFVEVKTKEGESVNIKVIKE